MVMARARASSAGCRLLSGARGSPVGNHCAEEQNGYPGCGGDRQSGAVSASSDAGWSGNHLREPPCALSQTPRDISSHGFRRSSGWPAPWELDKFPALFRLTSEKPVVRTHLRPPEFSQLDGFLETLIGDSAAIAGNNRCVLPDRRSVPSGLRVQVAAMHPPVTGCAIP